MKVADLRYALRYRIPSAVRALREDWQETAPRSKSIRYTTVTVAEVDRAIRDTYGPDLLASLAGSSVLGAVDEGGRRA